MAVRREAVLLELEDRFTRETLAAAAAAQALSKSLGSLSTSAVQSDRSLTTVERDVDGLGRTSRSVGSDIDKLSGRMAILARVAATVGPAIVPISGVAVAGLAGLASQAGFATAGVLSMVVAFQGVGDALKAVNEAALEPTAANIEKAQQAMARIGPEAQAFVTRFQQLRPVFGDIRDAAASGWFPGLTEALGHFETAAPRVERVMRAISAAGGDLVANGAESLASGRWADFFTFIENEAPAAMTALGRTVGSLAHGFSELWMAFDPLSDGMNNWLVDTARGFDSWASGLSETEGFREFILYVQQAGPQVAEAAAAIGDALVQIGQAAAPLGGPVLDAITGIANAIAAIADSPLGTPLLGVISALSAINLAARTGSAALDLMSGSASRAGGSLSTLGGKAAGVVAVAAAVSALGNAIADASGAKLSLSDLSRDLDSIANGKGGDTLKRLTDDFNIASMNIAESGEWFREPLTGFGLFGNTGSDNALENIEAVDQALASMVESGNAGKASTIYTEILESIRQAGGSQVAAIEQFDAFGTAMDNASSSADKGADATRGMGDAAAGTAGQVRGLTGALLAQATATLGAFEAETNWRKALVAARQAARQTSAGIRGNSEAALRNRDVLAQLAGAWQSQSAAVRGSESRLRAARRAFIQTAVDMGVPIAQARRLAAALIGIPASRKSKVTVDTGSALTQLGRVQAAIAAVQSKTVTIHTLHVSSSLTRRADAMDARPGGGVDGTTVPNDGGPYEDRFPYLLAPGEEVISNRRGQAARWRPLLKAINAGRLADGGTAGMVAGRPMSQRLHVSVQAGPLRGVIDGPSGPVSVEAQMRAIAREEIDQASTWDRTQGRR